MTAIWLGLDVAWDAYIGLGTLFLALAMLRHPRVEKSPLHSQSAAWKVAEKDADCPP